MNPSVPPLRETQVPPEQVAALYRAATEYVARATGCTLDGSEESLAFVDHYIETFSQTTRKPGKTGQPPTEVLRLTASALGVYLGELAIARFGGRWLALLAPEEEQDDAEPRSMPESLTQWRVELAAAPLLLDPIGMAEGALLPHGEPPGAADDQAPGFTLLPAGAHLYEPLHAALDRLSPVSEDYYYSLTGRFETLAAIVDLVIELQQQAATAPDGHPKAEAPVPPEHQ